MSKNKIYILTEKEGYSETLIMLRDYAYARKAPGICTNEGCDYTVNVKSDSDSGWCEMCETNTVVSCLMLAGMI